jgi:hypothetical protein
VGRILGASAEERSSDKPLEPTLAYLQIGWLTAICSTPRRDGANHSFLGQRPSMRRSAEKVANLKETEIRLLDRSAQTKHRPIWPQAARTAIAQMHYSSALRHHECAAKAA